MGSDRGIVFWLRINRRRFKFNWSRIRETELEERASISFTDYFIIRRLFLFIYLFFFLIEYVQGKVKFLFFSFFFFFFGLHWIVERKVFR